MTGWVGPAFVRVRVELVVLVILCAGLAWCDAPVFDIVLTLVGVR